MHPDEFDRLLSTEGQLALQRAAEKIASAPSVIHVVETLGREFAPQIVRPAVTVALLRRAARGKFRHADRMYFTRQALEQASGDIVAEHRANRFRGFASVADLCCGIGGDTLALARQTAVHAIDIDLLRLKMAEANARALQLSDRIAFAQSDVRTINVPPVDAAFIDPDRRPEGVRRVRLNDYEPEWEVIWKKLSRCRAWGVKAAPAIPWSDLELLDAEVEFISCDGELKECALWFGELRTVRRRATVLPSGEELQAEKPAPTQLGPVREFVHDPDPAVTRAGLVADLGVRLNAHQIDAQGAFLSGDVPSPTPLARSYRVEAVLPFRLRQLRQWFRARRIGRITSIKRGHAADVEQLRRQLNLIGEEHRLVIWTRIAGQPTVIVAPGHFTESISTIPESRR